MRIRLGRKNRKIFEVDCTKKKERNFILNWIKKKLQINNFGKL